MKMLMYMCNWRKWEQALIGGSAVSHIPQLCS